MEVTRDDWWAHGKEGTEVDEGSCGWVGGRRQEAEQEGVWGCPRASRWGWKRSLRGRASAGEKPLQRGSGVEKSGAP